jgi:glucose-6-phosphate 1-epimerase
MLSPAEVAEMNEKFGISGIAEIVAGEGGLPKIRVSSAGADGEMYLHGAHLTSWTPAGMQQDVIWLSRASMWETEKPIRGGVPICFPWFGPNPENSEAPAHGVARLYSWQLESIRQQDGAVAVTCLLRSDAGTKKWSPAEFELRYTVSFGARLLMSLEILNTGSTPLMAQEALHTYYSVGDVRQARVTGLEGLRYLDKLASREAVQQGAVEIKAETEYLYSDVPSRVEIVDPVLRRRIVITTKNAAQALVWNPWIEKSKRMPDFGDDEWPGMLCVETCNVAIARIEVAPGQRHTMTAAVDVAAD